MFSIYKFTNRIKKMNIKTVFGNNLKTLRKEKKLSQEQLSEKVNISVKHLSSIERGLTFVSAELLEKLSYALEKPVFHFFVKKDEICVSEILLTKLNRIIEKHLVKTIEDIKSDIFQSSI